MTKGSTFFFFSLCYNGSVRIRHGGDAQLKLLFFFSFLTFCLYLSSKRQLDDDSIKGNNGWSLVPTLLFHLYRLHIICYSVAIAAMKKSWMGGGDIFVQVRFKSRAKLCTDELVLPEINCHST